jgi:hypothetical protein
MLRSIQKLFVQVKVRLLAQTQLQPQGSLIKSAHTHLEHGFFPTWQGPSPLHLYVCSCSVTDYGLPFHIPHRKLDRVNRPPESGGINDCHRDFIFHKKQQAWNYHLRSPVAGDINRHVVKACAKNLRLHGFVAYMSYYSTDASVEVTMPLSAVIASSFLHAVQSWFNRPQVSS